MRGVAFLELEQPEIIDAGKPAAELAKEGFKVQLTDAAVSGPCVMIGQRQLRSERRERIERRETKTRPGLVGEAGNDLTASVWWCGVLATSSGTDNPERTGKDFKAVCPTYGSRNKSRTHRGTCGGK